MRKVYHFTSTDALPSIFRCGRLLPTTYDDPELTIALGDELVWATSSPDGDRTASYWHVADRRNAIESGAERLVRITLPSRDFVSWAAFRSLRMKQVHDREDEGFFDEAEKAEEVFDLYEYSGGYRGSRCTQWHVHPGAVPIRRALKVETRTRAGRWRSIKGGPITH